MNSVYSPQPNRTYFDAIAITEADEQPRRGPFGIFCIPVPRKTLAFMLPPESRPKSLPIFERRRILMSFAQPSKLIGMQRDTSGKSRAGREADRLLQLRIYPEM